MGYVAQLLPDLEEARVLRQALSDYANTPAYSEEQKDLAWKLLSKLTDDMRRNERAAGRSF